ncbi:MAG: DUF4293 domain-containing protein [Bacteroidales bacterium]|nr:DUF4293 domain-containing protein [Bacteroidales bacterium]
MIQRIQSIFLLLAFLAAVALFFYPLAGIYSNLTAYKFYIYGLKNMVPGEASQFSFMTTFPLLLLNILVAALSLICVFLYKNRVRQAKLVRLAILLEIVLIALVFFVYASIIERNLLASPDYLDEAGIYFPLISLIFLILANRYIMKDEKLVRSVDRLR